ncbi:hypothetical protein EVAR_18301_1 [Eumeta japonica]|uniref:Uncharacterized protein n=1 Tax=Eumeta variegata TaxID=151549 RepID=A0A4C1V960_EUMVA|nr:hypothetical protein EVAR_18301_1 [Eumeta japonica]
MIEREKGGCDIGTLTHWTKINSESCYFISLFCESMILHRSKGSDFHAAANWPRQCRFELVDLVRTPVPGTALSGILVILCTDAKPVHSLDADVGPAPDPPPQFVFNSITPTNTAVGLIHGQNTSAVGSAKSKLFVPINARNGQVHLKVCGFPTIRRMRV